MIPETINLPEKKTKKEVEKMLRTSKLYLVVSSHEIEPLFLQLQVALGGKPETLERKIQFVKQAMEAIKSILKELKTMNKEEIKNG